MIEVNVSGRSLFVDSSWDSGMHKGFHIALGDDTPWHQDSAEKFLTQEQIHGLEFAIAAIAKGFIEENKQGNSDD